ncbi:MAG: lysoplasmalogenase [Mycobacterium sp.]|mgnify:FL=1
MHRWWLAAAVVGAVYGVVLVAIWSRVAPGAALTGQFWAQPALKSAMAVLLAVAVLAHPIARERRWLLPALLFSAAGDFLLAIPWWPPSFVGGLSAFLLAHLCFLGALLPLAAPTRPRVVLGAVVVAACVGLLVWFWPHLAADGLTVPVTVYMLVLAAMVGSALLARLPTPWTALGALCFAVSDAMIGISEFIRRDQALAVPIWWAYAAAMVLIVAGLIFRRSSVGSATPST